MLRGDVFFLVYNNCPVQQHPQISRQLNTYGTLWSGNLLFLQSLPQALPNCDKGAKCLGQSIAGWHSEPSWPFACENTRLRCRQGRYTLYWCDYLGNSYCNMCVSFDLNLLSYTSTMINYLSEQFWIQWTCPRRCCFFSGSIDIVPVLQYLFPGATGLNDPWPPSQDPSIFLCQELSFSNYSFPSSTSPFEFRPSIYFLVYLSFFFS